MHARIQGYDVVLEKGPTSWGAYVPELPVCVAVADTREGVERDIAKAITMHLGGLREDEQARDAVQGRGAMISSPASRDMPDDVDERSGNEDD